MTFLTDTEARTTKLCPLQYTAEQGAVGCNGAHCMAWRWEAYRGTKIDGDQERRGYCGAFGIPMETIG